MMQVAALSGCSISFDFRKGEEMKSVLLDVDGTLIEDGTWSALIEQLLEDGLGRSIQLRQCLHELHDPGFRGMAAVAKYIPIALEDVTAREFREAQERAYRRIKFLPFSSRLSLLLASFEVRVTLVSGGPKYLVEMIGRSFNAASVHGSVFDARESRFAKLIDSKEKKEEVALAEIYTGGIRFMKSIAMGNGTNDIGILKRVRFPIALEPSNALNRKALDSGWPILDRDDVVDHFTGLLHSL